ncbi:MAG TPA: MaoC family dehydratase N-terminal domain-containing protein [Acidimicrobiia bacterium]|nr:MaoC family dehydratase N-terminal domain-containing protein [Acidimicrobiia bacterium]
MTGVEESVGIDTSDLDRYVGQSFGGGQLLEPIAVNDIRRWVQGMQYPNPLHYDAEFAATTRFGGIVAPQSFMVNTDIGHGSMPSVFGKIPGSHMVFGGDEWWFYGHTVVPGDQITVHRRHHDYRVAETKFAGPTVFGRGDSVHVNQRGEAVSKQRSTSVRYLVEEAKRRSFFASSMPLPPTWTAAQLDELYERRLAWILSGREGHTPSWTDAEPGLPLPTCPIGPHTIQTFATEWRAFTSVVWGTTKDLWKDFSGIDGGWLPEMTRDDELAKIDPSQGDGMYRGASRGHVDGEAADIVGLPRGYGYGASMGAWALNYVAFWSGHDGFIRHSTIQYRTPPFVGDVTFVDGTVTERREDAVLGVGIATVEVVMTNQDQIVVARGSIEVELPS